MNYHPLRMIHDAFWALLEASGEFKGLVTKPNRIKLYGGPPQPVPDQVGPANLPEVRLVPVGLEADAFSDSDKSGMRLEWEVQVATGEHQQGALLDVQWAVYQAMSKWETQLGNLEWEGRRFVSDARALVARNSMDSEELNRGVRGWSTVWACEISCHFLIADLEEG